MVTMKNFAKARSMASFLEFGSSACARANRAWAGFSVQLDNDAELMLYQIRRKGRRARHPAVRLADQQRGQRHPPPPRADGDHAARQMAIAEIRLGV
jgi:hypothetical protein